MALFNIPSAKKAKKAKKATKAKTVKSGPRKGRKPTPKEVANRSKVRQSFTADEKSDKLLALIERRRLQLLVHSCIYYKLNSSIWTDAEWNLVALHLVTLNKHHPSLAKQGRFADAFLQFDGSTGFDLPINDPWVVGTAMHLLKVHAKEVEVNGEVQNHIQDIRI